MASNAEMFPFVDVIMCIVYTFHEALYHCVCVVARNDFMYSFTEIYHDNFT